MRRVIMVAGVMLATTSMAVAQPTRTHLRCEKRFTLRMDFRAVKAITRGTRTPSHRNLRLLGYLERCQRTPWGRRTAVRYNHAQEAANARRRNPPMSQAVASVYDAAGGPIACGGFSSYDMGVANRSLPCGTQVRICYSSCVTAVVFDRGPYVDGRDFDLSRAVESATGFPDSQGVATIRYRVL